MNKLDVKEIAVLFLIILSFVITITVAVLEGRTKSVEERVTNVENTVQNVEHR